MPYSLSYPTSDNEPERLKALHELRLLYTPPEDTYDSIVKLAREMFGVSIALISLIDKDVQWFKAACGLSVAGTPREQAFCNYTIMGSEPFVVEDAHADPRFRDNPLVTGEPFIRFYAGAPITLQNGARIGSLCLIDTEPRSIGAQDLSRLVVLARITTTLAEHAADGARLEELNGLIARETQRLTRRNAELELMAEVARIGLWTFDPKTQVISWSREVRRIHEVSGSFEPDFSSAMSFFPLEVHREIQEGLGQCAETGKPWDAEVPLVTAKGNYRKVRLYGRLQNGGSNDSFLFGAVQDITDFAMARDELAASTRRLELAMESASIGLWDWDVSRDRLWTFPSWWHYLGFEHAPGPRSDAEADTVIHPDDLAGVKANRAAFLARKGEGRLTNEFRHLDGHGNWRWILSTGRAAAFNSDGSVARISGVYVDIHDRRQAAEMVDHAARHDVMTGLVNRAELKRRVTELFAGRQSEDDDFCILVIDLDGFKNVNDSFGHAAGDAVLKELAQRLKDTLRGGDMIARLGGDEFAVVLRGGHRCEHLGAAAARRILNAMTRPIRYDGKRLQVGASIGLARSGEHGGDFDMLIRNADAALYRVKLAGKNGFRFFDDEIRLASEVRRRLEAELRRALTKHQLSLHFQPQVRIATGEMAGVEALLRWNHPVLGAVPPDRFIPIAEETGLIVPIGEWVIDEACRLAAEWPDHVTVSINLSPLQLGKTNLVDAVTSALDTYGLTPGRLGIEVTESVFLNEALTPLADLIQLHELGVKLSLDDFGTGYASLSYLKKLPFDVIKIDRSFIRDMPTSTQSAAIVAAVVNLARSLGMETIAEGVETEEQSILLKAAGCSIMQGYLIGRPAAPEVLRRTLIEADQRDGGQRLALGMRSG